MSTTDFSFQNLEFRNKEGTFQFHWKFQLQFHLFSVKKSFNIQGLLHCKSKCHGTKPMHPSSLRAFQRHQEHDLKHPVSVDLITTKQNKLPSFIYRCNQYNIWTQPKKIYLHCPKMQLYLRTNINNKNTFSFLKHITSQLNITVVHNSTKPK
jgi:hypothetical protein